MNWSSHSCWITISASTPVLRLLFAAPVCPSLGPNDHVTGTILYGRRIRRRACADRAVTILHKATAAIGQFATRGFGQGRLSA